MSFSIVLVGLKVFLKLLNCLLVRFLGLLLFAERFIGESQPKVGFSQILIQLDGLLESLCRLVVLIASIKLFALFQ